VQARVGSGGCEDLQAVQTHVAARTSRQARVGGGGGEDLQAVQARVAARTSRQARVVARTSGGAHGGEDLRWRVWWSEGVRV
jgi:hypothetical protein